MVIIADTMRRRKFLSILCAFAGAPSIATSQTAKPVPRVGILTSGGGMQDAPQLAFEKGLRKLGYIRDQNLIIEFRSANGRTDEINKLAADLVALKVDVLVTNGSEATRAAIGQTTSIPIVMLSTNPVGLGFVQSLAKPGGNVTGVSLIGPETSGKRLELLKELLPKIKKVAVFWNPNDPGAQFSLQETQVAAKTLEIQLLVFETSERKAFDPTIRKAVDQAADALVLLPAPIMSSGGDEIAKTALQNRLPTLFFTRDPIRAGGLMSYGPDLLATIQRKAYFVDRILKGTQPADLPVEQPTKLQLAINMQTAKTLSIIVPPQLLVRADEIIE